MNLVTIFPLIRYWHAQHIQFNVGPGASVTVEDFWPDGRFHGSWWWQQNTLGNQLAIEMYVFAPAGWQLLANLLNITMLNLELDLHGGGTPMVRIRNAGAGTSNVTLLGHSWETY